MPILTPDTDEKKSSLRQMLSSVTSGFAKHDVLTLSAALAFYTALSLAPSVVIVLSLAGFLGESSQAQLVEQIRSVMGSEAAKSLDAIIQSSQERPQLRSVAGLVSTLILLFTASGVFAQIQASLNVIFEASSAKSSGLWSWLRKRLLSMGMVITLGFIAIVSLVMSAAVALVFTQEGSLWQLLIFAVSLLIFTILFAIILKYLPDRHITWRSSLIGGVTTAILFALGKVAIGLYLGRSAVGSSYGAAGSLLVLLTWVYYSGAILFTGAEITRWLTQRNPATQSI